MKLLINGLALISYLLVAPSLLAQSTKDAKATQILKEVSSNFKSLKSLKTSFNVTVNDLQKKTTNSQSGKLIIKGEKYRLELKGQSVISDGETVWTYLKEVNEVQINPVLDDSQSITPKNIFTIYENGFSSKYTGELDAVTKIIQQIELVPDDKEKSFFKIQLNIEKKSKRITGATIFEKSGLRVIYTIQSYKENIDVTDDDFTFYPEKYPDIEVIDLR
jgi:outer membrane lipoprotein carrier protein